MRQRSLSVRSRLAAPPAEVWARVSSWAGINAELAPWLRMTCPSGLARLDPALTPVGARLFRSVILLFDVLPVEYDDLAFERFEPGHGFKERSTTMTLRRWGHERTLTPHGSGCELTDRLTFVPRWAPLLPVATLVVRALFRHRHRRLRAQFGVLPG